MAVTTPTELNTADPKVQHAIKQGITKANVKRMLVFCLVFVVFQLSILLVGEIFGLRYLYSGSSPTPEESTRYIIVTLVAIGGALVFALLFGIINAGALKNPRTQRSLMQAALLVLTCAQLGIAFVEYMMPLKAVSFLFYVLLLGIAPVLPKAQGSGYILGFSVLFLILWIWWYNSLFDYPSSYELMGKTVEFSQGEILFSQLQQQLISALHEGQLHLFILGIVASLAVSWITYELVRKNALLELQLEQQQETQEGIIDERIAEFKEAARASEAANLAKTRFLTRVSHELRTAMTTISGMIFLAKETDDAQSRSESLDAIDAASQKIKSVVNSISDISQIEADYAGDDFNQDSSLLASDSAVLPVLTEPVTAPDLTGHTILIVEDLETNRLVLREFIKETNARVEEAVDGKKAVALFAASPEQYYSFIFMDLLMPEMNGHDATRAIRKMERKDALSIPIVAVSANAFKEDIEASLAAGMDAHLAKPIEQTTIFQTLKERLSS